MSRAVKPDHDADINKFTTLLKKAQGLRSQSAFARDAGISNAYMCKYLNQKFDNAPTPNTIKKIAACAANNVSLKELLDASGYDPEKHINSTVIKKDSFDSQVEKHVIATLISSLTESLFKWTSVPYTTSTIYDLSIELLDAPIRNWHFTIVINSPLLSDKVVFLNRIMSYYGKLAVTPHEGASKFSFVTDSEKLFDQLLQIKPFMLSMYISVILIDVSNMEIIKEEFITSALSTEIKLDEIYKLK